MKPAANTDKLIVLGILLAGAVALLAKSAELPKAPQ